MWWLLALLWSARCAALVRKCCPHGKSIAVGDGLSCVTSSHVWHYQRLGIGVPAGCQLGVSSGLQLAMYGDVVSCIDNLNGTETIVAVKCPNDRHNFTVPDVNYLPKCCPGGRAYDSIMQTCWGPHKKPSYPLINWLMKGAEGVVDISVGSPTCATDQVLVDHLVTYEKIHRSPTAAISFKDGERDYILNPYEACVELTERRDVWVVRTCEDYRVACRDNTCIRKCCPEEQSYYFSKSCVPSHSNFRPLTVYNFSDDALVPIETRSTAYWFDLNCEKYREDEADTYKLAIDGTIFSTVQNLWTDMGVFCIENVLDEEENATYVFLCFPLEPPSPEVNLWATIGMMVSCLFLLLTFLVYAILPSLKNLHGKTLMCHVSCLLVAYICLSTVRIFTDTLDEETCRIFGYVNLLSFMAAFFWLNVISFDIWWTFGSMRTMMHRRTKDKQRFLLYSAYAWLGALLITGLAVLNDYINFLPESFTANFGIDTCWFSHRTNGVFVFFNAPVGILLTINLVLFILTARHCSKVKSDLDKVGHTPIADKKFQSDKTRLKMNCKLFVAMGVNWFLEFLSVVSSRVTFIPVEIWYLSDMANACQGLVIFCIFVMKKRVLEELRRRLEQMICCRRPPPRQPSVSTLFSANNTVSTDLSTHVMKKSVSETRLSPLPLAKHKVPLKDQRKTKSTNRLMI